MSKRVVYGRFGHRGRLAATVALAVLALAAAACGGGAVTSTPRPAINGVANTTATSVDGDASNATWMHDLAPHIWYRKLDQVVIPGSHDSASYSLGGEFLGPYATAQNEDFTAQLNDGARNFDIRVGYKGSAYGCDWCGFHGIVMGDLSFSDILDQIKHWTLEPSHYHEVLMLSLLIDSRKTSFFPSIDCSNFDTALGSALLTPSEAQAHFGTTDPAQLTFGQLWSLQGPGYPQGPPRVIMNHSQCMGAGDPAAGQWSDTATSGGGLFAGYYADQCYAASYEILGPGRDGITNPTLQALQTRATQGGGDDGGHVMNLGPSKPAGFYDVGIEATPTQDCFIPLHWMLGEDERVLGAIYGEFRDDAQNQPGSAFLANINIVSGDFIQETDLVQDAIAMNEAYPIHADSITRQGPDTVSVEQGQTFPAGSFGASLTYQVGCCGAGPPTVNGATTATATSVNGVVDLDGLFAMRTGAWKLTASIPDSTMKAAWSLDVTLPTHYTLRAYDNNPTTVGAGQTTSTREKHTPKGFAVFAVDAHGNPVPGVQITCDAAAAGGTFPGGAKTATATTANLPGTSGDGVALCPAFTAPIRAGQVSILVTSSGAPTLALPLRVTPRGADAFVPVTGDLQSTPINTTFPVSMSGHFVDNFGNVLTRADLESLGINAFGIQFDVYQTASNPSPATWPDGSHEFTEPLSSIPPDGTVTTPPLRAGMIAQPNTSFGPSGFSENGVNIVVHGYGKWRLGVTPGLPATVAAAGGDGQHTETGKAFAHQLAAKVTDSAGNPIPGAPVTFQVSSGQATFPAPNLADLAKVRGDPAPPNGPNPPPNSVTVPADANGLATAPALTAGQSGDIEVTASASGVPPDKDAVFHLSASGFAPTAPKIDSLTNGDGQVSVAFSGATVGASPITSYQVTATDQSHPDVAPVTAMGPSSAIEVVGLTNGDTYVFTVTATSEDGSKSPPSAPSQPLNVDVGMSTPFAPSARL